MLVWCITLFGLGVAALLDAVFNYGGIFRTINSLLFLLVSLGLLIRARVLKQQHLKENLVQRNAELEEQVARLNQILKEVQPQTEKIR